MLCITLCPYLMNKCVHIFVYTTFIHPSLNSCFDRHDIQNCKNVNWVSGNSTGTS